MEIKEERSKEKEEEIWTDIEGLGERKRERRRKLRKKDKGRNTETKRKLCPGFMTYLEL
jgi:hypothetical protein